MAKKAKDAHVLIIRLSAMGDAAMTVPVILTLVDQYSGCKVTVLTKPQFAPIFESLGRTSVFPVDVKLRHKGISGLWRLFQELRRLDITHVADLHNVLRSNVLGLFFKLFGFPLAKIDKGRAEKKALTRKRNKRFKPLKTTIARYFQVFAKLGFVLDTKEIYLLPKVAPNTKMQRFLEPRPLKMVGIAPFAAYPSKMYRLELMEQVILGLLGNVQVNILLFGSPEEQSQLQELASKFDQGVRNVAGHLSFREELGLISNLDVMLAMDSGNGHLAANYGVPVVTLWGVTHPYAGFSPYDQAEGNAVLPERAKYPLVPTSIYGNSYPEEYREAINSIPTKTVVHKVLEVMNA